MKKVMWQDCETMGVTYNNHLPKPTFDNIKHDMQVSARFDNMDILLKIKRKINKDVFAATILSFEKVEFNNPDNLVEGDEVEIDRQHICWLFGD